MQPNGGVELGSEGCEGDILLNGGVELGRKVV